MDVSGVLEKIERLRVAVFGDLCLDVYLAVERGGSEKSRETGRRAAAVMEQHHSLGAAGNVAANAVALGATVEAFGVIGDDPYGRELRHQLATADVDDAAVLTENTWSTAAYIKHTVAGRETARFDAGVANALAATTALQLVASLERRLPELDVVILNQQLYRGVHTPVTHQRLHALSTRAGGRVTWVSDTRDADAAYPGTVRKLGEGELPRRRLGHKDLERLSRTTTIPWFVTLGARGAIAVTTVGATRVPAHLVDGPVDPVGAGDAFTVGAALALGAGLAPVQAAIFANAVAATTVAQVGRTGTASAAQVAALLAEA